MLRIAFDRLLCWLSVAEQVHRVNGADIQQYGNNLQYLPEDILPVSSGVYLYTYNRSVHSYDRYLLVGVEVLIVTSV